MGKEQENHSVAEAGSSLAKAWTRMERDTESAFRQQGLVFYPVALETLGRLHTVVVVQVKQLGAALARQTGCEEREVLSQLFQRLSLQLL